MRLSISTILNCTPETAWNQVLKTRLLVHVSYPLVVFTPIDPPNFPSLWTEGRYLVKIWLGGVIPFGRQVISISIPESDKGRSSYRLRDNGSGSIISTWNHLISIDEAQLGRTVYTDTVDIEAGLLTPFVWLYASLLYRYRQKRWKQLVANGFRYN